MVPSPTEKTPLVRRSSSVRKSIRSITSSSGVGSVGEDDISEFDAMQHLIKGNLGPGVLNLPHAFALSGWMLGFFLCFLVAFQGIYSMVLLVYCKEYVRSDIKLKREEKQRKGIPATNEEYEDENNICTFMDIAHAIYGDAGSITVQILLFVLQGGVCCVFLSLIATNLHALLPAMELEVCVIIVTGLLLLVVLVRSLKELKWLSLGANCLMIIAILTASVSAMYALFVNGHDADTEEGYKRYTKNPAVIATFVSSMFYAFEGIGLVMPIENSYVGYKSNDRMLEVSIDEEDNEDELLRKGSRVKSFINPVLIGSMSLVAFLFLLIGVTCGPAFPDIIDGSVTAYLTTKYPDSLWYQLVNASVMVAVFLTFPLQLTPAMEVLQEWFGPGCNPCNHDNDVANRGLLRYEWIFRRFLVVLSCAFIVLSVNDLGLLMSLFGAVGNTGLAAMPCILHLQLMKDEKAPYNLLLFVIDVCTVTLAVAVAVTGVVFSLQQI